MKERLNFAPVPFRRRQNLLILLWALNLSLIAGIGWAIWHWQDLRNQNQSAHSQIDGLKQRQAEIAAENQGDVNLLDAINTKDYRKQVELFHGAQLAFQTHWGQLLDELANLVPEDVRLRELHPTSSKDNNAKGQRLVLRAEARTKDAQLDFIGTLQKNASFSEVSFESETYAEQESALSFEISFSYAGGIAR